MLQDFLATNGDEVLARARLRVVEREAPQMTGTEMTFGLPTFLDQLHTALARSSRHEGSDHAELKVSASLHGSHLFHQGLTVVARVVNGYGDLC